MDKQTLKKYLYEIDETNVDKAINSFNRSVTYCFFIIKLEDENREVIEKLKKCHYLKFIVLKTFEFKYYKTIEFAIDSEEQLINTKCALIDSNYSYQYIPIYDAK